MIINSVSDIKKYEIYIIIMDNKISSNDNKINNPKFVDKEDEMIHNRYIDCVKSCTKNYIFFKTVDGDCCAMCQLNEYEDCMRKDYAVQKLQKNRK